MNFVSQHLISIQSNRRLRVITKKHNNNTLPYIHKHSFCALKNHPFEVVAFWVYCVFPCVILFLSFSVWGSSSVLIHSDEFNRNRRQLMWTKTGELEWTNKRTCVCVNKWNVCCTVYIWTQGKLERYAAMCKSKEMMYVKWNSWEKTMVISLMGLSLLSCYNFFLFRLFRIFFASFTLSTSLFFLPSSWFLIFLIDRE